MGGRENTIYSINTPAFNSITNEIYPKNSFLQTILAIDNNLVAIGTDDDLIVYNFFYYYT